MRVLICGSRDWSDQRAIRQVVRSYANAIFDRMTLIEGEAPGADTMAREWAERYGVPVEKYPADWDKFGKAAGPIRNKQMLVEGKPDVVWAFVNKPLEESRGTANMVKQAHAAGIPVYVVEAW